MNFDRAAIERDPTDFIRYPYSVEIEAEPGATLDRYLEVVASIMMALHVRVPLAGLSSRRVPARAPARFAVPSSGFVPAGDAHELSGRNAA